ncbi:hypothetical protein VTL71DRAFT_10587 [Oculimacula yallundae]|uniref:Uncharacterized protein n=1 Tax=Oculimacula yallundae TaxID=86028 RepID=A0ABR4CTF4_9HELO
MGDITKSPTVLGLAEQISRATSKIIISKKHSDLLDIINALRPTGVSRYISLPQIIVCGSQSSGKSSTLESLSGIAFPTAEGFGTRFVTELTLRRSEKSEIKVQIQPSASRIGRERDKLLKFHRKETEQENLGQIIEAAKVALGLNGTTPNTKLFGTDVLRIESTSPTAPNLKLVDLPGLSSFSDKDHTDDDLERVQDLIVGYMKQKQSIILAVVSADRAFADQPVTKLARAIDPSGTRTLGIITKLDKIGRGSNMEKYYIGLARNENFKLTLGWHVLRNKCHATANDTTDQREQREATFFAASGWNTALEPFQLGVANLRERLRRVLWDQIYSSLPGVIYAVQMGLKDCTSKLHQLGKARSTDREKHKYLYNISSKLSTMVKAAIDGVYVDPFFESYPGQQDALDRRLRDRIQQILTTYADNMVLAGHALEIVEDGQNPTRQSPLKFMMRNDYLDVVKELMGRRGPTLPGTFDPLVVGDLFSRQCKPWKYITQNLVEQVHEAAAITFHKILSEICDDNDRIRLMQDLIQPSLHKLRQGMKAKLHELLEPHLATHPITYNDHLIEAVQKIQGHRYDRAFDALSLSGCGLTSNTIGTTLNVSTASVLITLYLLKKGTRPNLEEYSASLAADVAATYYEARSLRAALFIALKKFIHDVSVNAIESCFIQKLPKVFGPDVVARELSEEQVKLLASVDERTVAQRVHLQKKHHILSKVLSDLEAFSAGSSARGTDA